MHTHIKSEESSWRAVVNDNTVGPYQSITFKNDEGFEAQYAVDYRSLHARCPEFPTYFILETLDRYDKWREEREDRKSE